MDSQTGCTDHPGTPDEAAISTGYRASELHQAWGTHDAGALLPTIRSGL